MSFPTTRRSLIHRIADQSQEDDWRQFLTDYWGPLCRFAARWGSLTLDDAEDVAAATLEALIRSNLLARWLSAPRAKLRTLLCTVARNVIAGRTRDRATRPQLVQACAELDERTVIGAGGEFEGNASDQGDVFYAAWAEDLLQSAVESLMDEFHAEGCGDWFRVLYGKICEGITSEEIAESLELKATSVDYYFRQTRERLESKLKTLVRRHVSRYSSSGDVQSEFRREWDQLGSFLRGRGGLENAVRQAYDAFDSEELRQRQRASTAMLLTHLRASLQAGKGDADKL